VNEDGDPMANVNVQALRYGYREGTRKLEVQAEANTNDLGEYRIFGLLPHKYYVRATVQPNEYFFSGSQQLKHSAKAPEQAYLPLFYPDTKSAAAATPVEVKAADEQHANFTLVPAPAFRVFGKVTGIPPSAPGDMESVVATLIRKDNSEPAGTATLTAKDSAFAIGPAPPGEYWLVAFSAEVRVGDTRNLEKFRIGHVPVTVVAADVPNTIVSLESSETLRLPGKIRLDPSPPLAVDLRELYVSLDPADEESAMQDSLGIVRAMEGGGLSQLYGKTNINGGFTLSLGASGGKVQPRLNARSHGFEDYYTKSVLLSGRDVTETGFAAANISPGATLELIVSPYGGRIDGVVLDSNKKPVTGALVACVPEPKLQSRRELFVTDRTNQQGHYTLRGLRPGSYKLYAFDEIDPGAIYSSEFLKPFEEMGETLNVQERDTLTKPLQVLHHTED
jgi:hypothetical protein